MRGPRQVPILEIDRLAVAYETRHGDVAAVRDVCLLKALPARRRGSPYSLDDAHYRG